MGLQGCARVPSCTEVPLVTGDLWFLRIFEVRDQPLQPKGCREKDIVTARSRSTSVSWKRRTGCPLPTAPGPKRRNLSEPVTAEEEGRPPRSKTP